MGWSFRKSKSWGPLRLTLGKRGLTAGLRLGPVSVNRRSTSVSLPGTGLRYTRRNRRGQR